MQLRGHIAGRKFTMNTFRKLNATKRSYSRKKIHYEHFQGVSRKIIGNALWRPGVDGN